MKILKLLFLTVIFYQNVLSQSLHIAGLQTKIINGKPNAGPVKTNSILGLCDTVFSFPTIGTWPGGLTFDDTYLYSCDVFDPFIDVYTLSGQLSQRIPSPGQVGLYQGDLDFDGTYLWQVVEQDARIYKMNPVNGTVLLSFPLPTGTPTDPNNYGCAYDNGFLWITEYIDGTLMRFDASTGALVDSFVVNRRVLPLKNIDGQLYGIGLDSGSQKGTLYHFNKSNGAILDSMDWCIPYSTGLCKKNNEVWCLSSSIPQGTQQVYKLNNVLLGVSANNTFDFFQVFPNPLTSFSTLQLSTQLKNAEVIIYDMLGKEMGRKKMIGDRMEIEKGSLESGIYFVRVREGEREWVGKMVVE